MAAMSIQRVMVHGGVQGVNYRLFVEDNANALSLEGWVRNMRDGTVEAVFSGPDADVTAMIARCWKPQRPASSRAYVDKVETFAAGADDLKLRPRGGKFSRLPDGP
jgi:acylphosphatase